MQSPVWNYFKHTLEQMFSLGLSLQLPVDDLTVETFQTCETTGHRGVNSRDYVMMLTILYETVVLLKSSIFGV